MLLLEEKLENGSVCYFDSSNIHACKYNNDTNQLAIIFKGGVQYVYENIINYNFQRFKVAESQGKHFRDYIKDKFKFAKVEGKVDMENILTLIEQLKKKKSK
jgi:hypothetical protein